MPIPHVCKLRGGPIRSVRIIFALFCVCAMAAPGFAAEYPLEMKQFPSTDLERLYGLPGDWGHLMTAKGDGIKNEPPAPSSNSIYGVVPFDGPGQKGMALRIDQSDGASKKYDLLILDLNRNGDLSDDQVIRAAHHELEGSSSQVAVFGPFEMNADEDGPWRLTMFGLMNAYNLEAIGQTRYNTYAGMFALIPACYLQADIEVGGVKERIGFVDGNGDMRVGDTAGFNGDMLLRDRGGSGGFDTGMGVNESETMKEIVYFAGKPHRMVLAEDFKTVSVEPYDGPMGKLASRGLKSVRALTLARKAETAEWDMLDPHPVDGQVSIPVGTYSLSAVTINATDEQGRKWTSEAYCPKVEKTVEVDEGETAAFPVGEPFELKISAGVSGSSGKTGFLGALASALSQMAIESMDSEKKITLNVQVVGAGGETYSRFFVDGQPVEAPRFVVKNKDGKQVASGQFEYG